jgi:hypothetical protein
MTWANEEGVDYPKVRLVLAAHSGRAATAGLALRERDAVLTTVR